MLRLFLLAPFLSALAVDFPTPPVQTAVQKSVVSANTARAKAASDAATSHVTALFDGKTFRAGLQKCCPDSAALSSQELLLRLRAEIRTAEVAHTFPSGFGKKSHFTDMTIPLATQYSWFLNEWQAPIITNSTAPVMYNLAEERIFGLPAFANESQPTWDEAANRVIYTALNLLQVDTGSLPTFGDVAAIFRKPYIQDMVEIAAVDTGIFEMSCNHSAYPAPRFGLNLTCNAWKPPQVGTFDHIDHIILANLGTWSSQLNNSIEEQAVQLFGRSAFAGNYLNIPEITSMQGMTYFEANIIGNPRLPDGISFLIGNFHTLFGTDAGRELQLLADHYSWPLVWGLGSSSSMPHADTGAGKLQAAFPSKNTSFAGNQRVLDPEVMASQAMNATVAAGARDVFVQVWAEVLDRKKNPFPIGDSQWAKWWGMLTDSQARLAPLTARAGCSDDLCIGTMAVSGKCVCKHAKVMVV